MRWVTGPQNVSGMASIRPTIIDSALTTSTRLAATGSRTWQRRSIQMVPATEKNFPGMYLPTSGTQEMAAMARQPGGSQNPPSSRRRIATPMRPATTMHSAAPAR